MTVLKFLPEPAACRKCGLPSPTAKFGGRVPLHVGCDHRAVQPLEPDDLLDVMTCIAQVLGPVEFSPPRPAARPKDVGPCVRCQRPTCRYGPYGRALCHHCDEGSPPLVDPLFPLAVCHCGHAFPVPVTDIDLEPPCPTCLESEQDSHDCPLSVKRKVTRT